MSTGLDFDDEMAGRVESASVQMNEYVADVAGALSEMYRILRPGDRAVIISTDWDSIVNEPASTTSSKSHSTWMKS